MLKKKINMKNQNRFKLYLTNLSPSTLPIAILKLKYRGKKLQSTIHTNTLLKTEVFLFLIFMFT